tara:strand:- start:5887 stop:6180 length:294 start_codon:yes stop_codon:yes gene_type:complete
MTHQFRSPVAKRFVDNLFLDLNPGPSDRAAWIDFGFDQSSDPQDLYATYQRALKSGKATPEQFDAAVGDGPMLTAIVQTINPEMTVSTAYDLMGMPE